VKVFIAVPSFGYQINSETTASLVALTKEMTEAGIFGGFSALSFPDIVDLRNVFLSVWYDALDATHMLFVDADMQFEPALIRDMLNADKPLIGSIYPKKRLPMDWVGSALVPPAEPEGGLLELQGLGCGTMLIRRDCIDNMIEAGTVEIDTDLSGTALNSLLEPHGVKRIIRAFDKITTPDKRKLSEDFSLCYRHRKAGGKVYAAINHQITHLGVYPFSARYGDMYAMKEAAE
jgi:hypothetical protein